MVITRIGPRETLNVLNFIFINRTHEETSCIVLATIRKIFRKTFFKVRYCIYVLCINISTLQNIFEIWLESVVSPLLYFICAEMFNL